MKMQNMLFKLQKMLFNNTKLMCMPSYLSRTEEKIPLSGRNRRKKEVKIYTT